MGYELHGLLAVTTATTVISAPPPPDADDGDADGDDGWRIQGALGPCPVQSVNETWPPTGKELCRTLHGLMYIG